jgi:GT2 family glycosyltransferase
VIETTVAAIVVTYDRRDVLEHTLAAVEGQTRAPGSICVVDNASLDGSEAMVRSRFPGVDYLRLDDNTGPAGGFAAGLRHLANRPFEYFWFLDDDSHPSSTALERILEVARCLPQCGAVGLDGGRLRCGVPVHGVYHSSARVLPEIGPARHCDFVLWDGAVIPSRVVADVGYPREELFIMMEDVEYTNRIMRAGWEVLCLEEPLIQRAHLGSGGAGSSSLPPPWRGYYQTRNHLLVIREHHSVCELAAWLWRLSKQLVATVVVLDRRRERLRMRLLGAWHGVIKVSGRRVEPGS